MSGSGQSIELVSVAVGLPAVIGHNRNGEVWSGIAKREVGGPMVMVRRTNIDGDGQADLRAHGGVDKAVYCYPRQHRRFWADQLGDLPTEAPLGENLSIEGVDEEEVRIGDTWRWGNALLQVSQPRWPCFKLAIHTGQPDMVKQFVASGYSGWYLRVLEEGEAPVSGQIQVIDRDPVGITVRQCMLARRGDLAPGEVEHIFSHPALATAWKS